MPNNIDLAIHRTLAAKLRERRLSPASAEHLASLRAAEARTFFDKRVAAHGGPSETAYETALDALTVWADQLKI